MSAGRALLILVLALAAMLGGSVAGAQPVPIADSAQAHPSSDVLESVSAVSPGRAWAVGFYKTTAGINHALVLRRNGKAWSVVKAIPNPGSTDNKLFGVSATSAANAWAVGYYRTRTGFARSLILRWDGTSWSRARARHLPTADNELTGVAAVSRSDAWAVGYYRTRTGSQRSLILRWNGTRWSRAGIKDLPRTANLLSGAAAASGSSAWAVGDYRTRTGSQRSLILRWNGTRWSRAGIKDLPPAANHLTGVAAASGSTAWAVGENITSTNTSKTLILHGNGARWSQAGGSSPSPSRLLNVLNGVSATSAGNAWAVGQDTDNRTALFDALIVRWNGHSWSRAHVRNLPSADNNLTAVSAVSPSSAWAVGYSCTNAACSTSKTIIVVWDGSAWHPVPSPDPR